MWWWPASSSPRSRDKEQGRKGCLAERLGREDWHIFYQMLSRAKAICRQVCLQLWLGTIEKISPPKNQKREGKLLEIQKKDAWTILLEAAEVHQQNYMTSPSARSEEDIPPWSWVCCSPVLASLVIDKLHYKTRVMVTCSHYTWLCLDVFVLNLNLSQIYLIMVFLC